jgi:hypothetical protein
VTHPEELEESIDLMSDWEPSQLTSEAVIERAWIAIPALVEELTGRDDITPAAFKQEPQGQRLTVLLDRPPETYGGVLHLPESSKDYTPISAGIVIGVGPLAGSEGVPHPGGPICHPSQLLYRHVGFGQHSGHSLRFTVRDGKYESDILILNCRDIWVIDWDDDPFAEEREEMEAFRRKEEEEAAAKARLEEERAAQVRLQDHYVNKG